MAAPGQITTTSHHYPATRRIWLCALVPVLALTGCGAMGGDDDAGDDAAGDDCVEDYDPEADYFPDQLSLDHAENLDIDYENHYQVVTVDEPAPGADPESYVLLRCGTPEPELDGDLAEAPVVEVPVDSVFAGSTTHLPLFAALDQAETVTGVADGTSVTTPEVRQQLDDGEVTEFTQDHTIDQELVAAEDPDLLMTDGSDVPEHQGVREAGVPVLANAEWLEPSPLGRAEWIKLAAALTGTEEQANAQFADIEADYAEIAERADNAEEVGVLPGHLTDGTWYMPAGDSYVGTLLADAGTDYASADTTGGESVELDLEEVLSEAQEIEPWIAAEDWEDLADVTAADERYAEFAAFESGAVWTNNNDATDTGGIPYWEEGVTRPDLVLADLVKIVHPDLLDEHELVYYRQLDEE